MVKEQFNFDYTPAAPTSARILPTRPITITGFSGDHIFETVRATRKFYEYACLESVLCALPAPPAVVIDIGANIGNHTIFFSRILNSRVISVEPDCRTNSILAQNLSFNEVEHLVTLCPVAAGHQDGSITFVPAKPQNLGMSCVSLEPPSMKCLNVPMLTIDSIVAQHKLKDVSLIKIDVEGFEAQVLLGAQNTLSAFRPNLIIEVECYNTNSAIDDYLRAMGYNYSIELPSASQTRLYMTAPPNYPRLRQYLLELAALLTRPSA